MGEETQQDESGLLTVYNVTRAHAGRYECLADNGIAPPASAHIQLVVQCEFVYCFHCHKATKHFHFHAVRYLQE